MRFAIIRKADENTEKGRMPSNEMLLAMGRYNEELVNAGVMRAGEGLHPTSEGLRLTFRDGQPVVTGGPFPDTRDQIAGFTLIEVGSKEEAIDWATKWPRLDTDNGAELELRQLYEQDDFEPGEGIDLHSGLTGRLPLVVTRASAVGRTPGSRRGNSGSPAPRPSLPPFP